MRNIERMAITSAHLVEAESFLKKAWEVLGKASVGYHEYMELEKLITKMERISELLWAKKRIAEEMSQKKTSI